jgi:hypothetical protein
LLLAVPLSAAAFFVYRAKYRNEPEEDDFDLY